MKLLSARAIVLINVAVATNEKKISILNHALRGCSRAHPLRPWSGGNHKNSLPLSFHPSPPFISSSILSPRLSRFQLETLVSPLCNSFIIGTRCRKIDRRFSMFVIILNDASFAGSAPGPPFRSLLRRRARRGAFHWNTNARCTSPPTGQWILLLFFPFLSLSLSLFSPPLRPRLFRFPSFSFLLRRSSLSAWPFSAERASASSIHVRRFLYGRAAHLVSHFVSTRLRSTFHAVFVFDSFLSFFFFFSFFRWENFLKLSMEMRSSSLTSGFQWYDSGVVFFDLLNQSFQSTYPSVIGVESFTRALVLPSTIESNRDDS